MSLALPLTLPSIAKVASGSTNFQILTPDQAAAGLKSGNRKVLDVRPVPPLDYIGGHVHGAVHLSEQAFRGPNGRLPFQIWGTNELAGLLSRAAISNKDSVLIYSGGNNGLGASLVAYILDKSGVPKVAIPPSKPAASSPPSFRVSISPWMSCSHWWAGRTW